MARKEIDFEVADEGRDKGKLFHIKEMDAYAGQCWAIRFFAAMVNAGLSIPDQAASAGMAAVFAAGFRSIRNLKPDDMISLLNDLMSNVTIVRDARNPGMSFPLRDDDIEEIMTRFTLAGEVFKLNTGFLKAAALSISIPGSKPAA